MLLVRHVLVEAMTNAVRTGWPETPRVLLPLDSWRGVHNVRTSCGFILLKLVQFVHHGIADARCGLVCRGHEGAEMASKQRFSPFIVCSKPAAFTCIMTVFARQRTDRKHAALRLPQCRMCRASTCVQAALQV